MEGAMRVSVVATGIDAKEVERDQPSRRKLAAPIAQRVEHEVEEAEQQEEADIPAVAARSIEPEPSLFDGGKDDGTLPPPAYNPQPQQPRMAAQDNAAAQFVAPRPPSARPAPGTPTPEALARLRAAVNKVPSASTPTPGAGDAHGDRRGFGINSLIGRMTGHDARPLQSPRSAQPHEEENAPAEDERIEIPAFLRRQAN
jgi:cell division protein FtsZ